jgi:hypothetical protein
VHPLGDSAGSGEHPQASRVSAGAVIEASKVKEKPRTSGAEGRLPERNAITAIGCSLVKAGRQSGLPGPFPQPFHRRARVTVGHWRAASRTPKFVRNG